MKRDRFFSVRSKNVGDENMCDVSRAEAVVALPISNRLKNCLQRLGIHTVGDFLDFPREGWKNQRSVGLKTLGEIYTLHDTLQNSNREVCEQTTQPTTSSFYDQSLDNFIISNRLRHCLQRLQIETVGQLLAFPQGVLEAQRNIGVKTLVEIQKLYDFLKGQAHHQFAQESAGDSAGAALHATALAMAEAYAIPVDYVHQILLDISRQNPSCAGETLTYLMYENETILNALKGKILRICEEHFRGVTLERFHRQLPDHLGNTTIVEEVLLTLENDGEVRCEDAVYVRRYVTLDEFVETITKERWKEAVEKRLQGESLEQIALSFGLKSRERVRQILVRAFSNKPRLEEDAYQDVYLRYDLDEKTFCFIFSETSRTYHYLDIVASSRGVQRQPLTDMLQDAFLSVAVKKKVEQVVFRNYITVSGTRIPKTRADLFRFVVKQTCRDKTPIETAIATYSEFLEQNDLQDDETLRIDTRTYENKLQKVEYALWNRGHSFRYYNINEREYSEFVAQLDLCRYMDKEFSTLKLFRDHPELMAEYDVRDEYELHSLLRKIWEDWGDCEVTFSKMPILSLGTPDRDNQVLELLLQYAPISNAALAEQYEETYGVRATTAQGAYFRCIDEYLSHGEYTISCESMTQEQFARMRTVLTEDFYTLRDVRRLFENEYPEANRGLINAYNLKTLGYHVLTDYVVRKTYSNATEYFESLLTTEDVVDTASFPSAFSNITLYTSRLSRLRQRRDIIEFEPKKYINFRRLKAIGITPQQIEEYCEKVYAFLPQGTIFTIFSLRKAGFTHELDDLYFDEWFYSSLLTEDRERFRSQKAGGTRLLRVGTEDVQISTFIEWIIEREERMELDDLVQLLHEQYGVMLSRDKVLLAIHDTSLYYDAIMDAVYVDYETYYEEV